jgi:type II secretion system protein N
MKRIAIVIGSMLWGLAVFRIALGIHFPSQEIKNRIEVEVDQSTKSEMQLKLGDFGLSGLIGLEAVNATLYQKDGEESIPTFVLDRLSVALSPIQTLLGALGVSIDGEMLGGTLAAYVSADSLSPNAESMELDLDLTSMNLAMLPIMSDSFEANLEGLLTAHVEGTFPQELPHKNANGRLSLSINGLAISDAKAQGIDLPPLTFTQASIDGLFDKGKLEITDANFVSESIGLALSGDILLAKQWQRSRLRLSLELTLGSEFALIAKMLPQLKNNKVREEDGNGIYKLNIIGTIQNPRIKTGNRKTNRRPTPDRRDAEQDEDLDIKKPSIKEDRRSQSPEERRKARRERIEARKRAQEARKEAGALDIPDNPRRAMPSRPLQRVPTLAAEEDMDEMIDEDEDIIEDDEIIEDEEIIEDNNDDDEDLDDEEE